MLVEMSNLRESQISQLHKYLINHMLPNNNYFIHFLCKSFPQIWTISIVLRELSLMMASPEHLSPKTRTVRWCPAQKQGKCTECNSAVELKQKSENTPRIAKRQRQQSTQIIVTKTLMQVKRLREMINNSALVWLFDYFVINLLTANLRSTMSFVELN